MHTKPVSFTLSSLLFAILLLMQGCVATNRNLEQSQTMRAMSVPNSWCNSSVVLLDQTTDIRFVPDSKGNRVTEKETSWFRVCGTTGEGLQYITVPEHKTYESPVRITASAYYPDGSSWVLPDNKIHTRQQSFTDSLLHSFTVPKYQKDMLVQLEITREIHRPEFIGYYPLHHRFPVINRTVNLSYPAAVELKYGLRNGEEMEVDESQQIIDGIRQVTVKANHEVNFREKERTLYPEEYYAAFYVSFPPKGNSSYSWQQLGDHYLNLSGESVESSEAVRRLATAIPDDKSIEDQLHSAFTTMVEKIRYHGDWSDGYAFFSRPAGVVVKNGYGDCKEMSTILKSMLQEKNISTSLVLLSVWDSYQAAQDYPSLAHFNHMILRVEREGGTPIYLDGTHGWATSTSSYYASVGRKGLVLQPGNSHLTVIGPGDDYANRVVTRSTVEESDGFSRYRIKGELELIGYPALRFYESVQEFKTKNKTPLARKLLEESFGLNARQVEVERFTPERVTISYVAPFDENLVTLGKGGFRLSVPGLYKPDVNHTLDDILGPVYLHQFSQEDHWQLPFRPAKSELPRYSGKLATTSWRLDGSTITRNYTQPETSRDAATEDIHSWIRHLGALRNSVTWR